MTFEFIWQLPARGDARYADATRRLRGERQGGVRPYGEGISDPRGTTFNYFDHLHQIARAAELARFDAIRVEHDTEGDDAFIVSGYVARGTRALRIITELEASWGSAVYAAKNAVSFQRYTGGRLAWHLVRGPSEAERRRRADPVADADLDARIGEFLTVARGVITRAPYTFEGRFFEVEDGGFRGTLAHHPVPKVYLDGESVEAHALSAAHADIHVFPALAPAELVRRVASLRSQASLADRAGRELAFGVRLEVVARETVDEARRDADRYVRQGGVLANDALVGSYDDVIAALVAYTEVGVTSVSLVARPHLEEAYRLGTHVLPIVRQRLSQTSIAA